MKPKNHTNKCSVKSPNNKQFVWKNKRNTSLSKRLVMAEWNYELINYKSENFKLSHHKQLISIKNMCHKHQ